MTLSALPSRERQVVSSLDDLPEVVSLDDLPELVTVEEFAAFTRQGLTKAYEDVRRGRIQSVRLGRTIRIPRQAIEALINGDEAENKRAEPSAASRCHRP